MSVRLFVWLVTVAMLVPALGYAQTPAPAGRVETTAPAQDPTRERDLVLERTTPREAPQSGVPRGYALIIGISTYTNLDAARQLQFAQSDAETVYRTIISQEAGAFPAENVHVLMGQRATLAAIRHELEEWLPSVAQPADRVVVYELHLHVVVDVSVDGVGRQPLWILVSRRIQWPDRG